MAEKTEYTQESVRELMIGSAFSGAIVGVGLGTMIGQFLSRRRERLLLQALQAGQVVISENQVAIMAAVKKTAGVVVGS